MTITKKRSRASSSSHDAPPAVKPSLCLLFCFLTWRDRIFLFLPAVSLSIAVGLVPAIMSKTIGSAFDAFTAYNLSGIPPTQLSAAVNHHFLNKVLGSVYILLGLAAATFVVSTVGVSVWICLGERLTRSVRTMLFTRIMAKKMQWYDLGMGLRVDKDDVDQQTADVSPAGLMAKVARESDDLRVAVSRQLGDVIQHLTTAIASLILALYSSWSLTLVILASVPVILLITVVTEVGAAPALQRERISTAHATGMVETVVQSINTVKAFNAQVKEKARFESELRKGSLAYRRTLLWWALRFGVAGGLVFAMFVQGFWYGSHLVHQGKLTPGQVMTVFMASLLVAAMLNEIVQSLSYIEKGKIGIANIVNLINSSDQPSPIQLGARSIRPGSKRSIHSLSAAKTESSVSEASKLSPSQTDEDLFSIVGTLEYDFRKAKAIPMSIEAIPHTPSSLNSQFRAHSLPPLWSPGTQGFQPAKRVQGLRRIVPATCQGELHFRNVTFCYPSRANEPVLSNASLYIPASEVTYIVGGSGSGKSTIAQLLLRLYEPTAGTIQLDDQMFEYLDPDWCKQQIATVSQNPIIFDMSIHDNVAIGLVGKAGAHHAPFSKIPVVSRKEVESACRIALLHDFIRDLDDGYDTLLGQAATAFSGGQKQRLAIARAMLSDPPILVLDEATSALDPTTRLLVHEAIKKERRGKTTIIITHDLSQIEQNDFLYLLENGVVAQQGYRSDLEAREGPFKYMAEMRSDDHSSNYDQELRRPNSPVDHELANVSETALPTLSKRLTGHRSFLALESEGNRLTEHLSFLVSQKLDGPFAHLKPLRLAERQAMQTYLEDAETLTAIANRASARRIKVAVDRGARRDWNTENLSRCPSSHTTGLTSVDGAKRTAESSIPSIKDAATILWATIPSRAVFILGVMLCVVAGTLTPIFSYILAQLLSTMGQTGQSGTVLKWSLLVLLTALLEGAFSFLRFVLMETIADEWILRLRVQSYANVVGQDRPWFDEPDNSASRICQSIVKDADDARNLVGQIIGQLALVLSMISLGIVWALVAGWKLTLVGIAFGPVFIVAISAQSRIISFYEVRNKAKREKVSECFYAMVSNIRSIRSMHLESIFQYDYDAAVKDAQRCGMRSSIFSGFGRGMSEALTYLAEALMFFVGAKLMISGEYDFKRMIQVFNLIIFAVTFAAQMLTFLPGFSKSIKALVDLNRLSNLPTAQVQESKGSLVPYVEGRIQFFNVEFAYHLRPDLPVLKRVNMEILPGECVAIVGGSGCGKSTIAALLQRMYVPTSGSILLDGTNVESYSITWLREHISVVSQSPNMFDMSISQNIAYGANSKVYQECPVQNMRVEETTMESIRRVARSANAADFIESLPDTYDTMLGEGNMSKISGGQAQRLAIARALMRLRAKILILDECTSALDVQNQKAIVETLVSDSSEVRLRKMTTLVITHNLEMMRRCDRIIVLQNGRVFEEGTYSSLIATKGGYFASLARGGEWSG